MGRRIAITTTACYEFLYLRSCTLGAVVDPTKKFDMKAAEAISQRCFVKKVSLEILQNSQVNTSFLIKNETLAQVFSCEFCEISKNIFSCRTPAVDISEIIL